LLKNYNQNITCYANSVVGEDNVIFMSASIAADGTYSISQNVQNVELYEANKKECDKDYAEFKKKVDDIVTKF